MHISTYHNDSNAEDRKLPLYVATVGDSSPQAQIHRPAGIPDYQLLYTLSGEGIVRFCNRDYTVHEGQLLILPPFSPHEYRPKQEWKTLWITYGGNMSGVCFPFEANILESKNFPSFYHKIMALKKEKNWRRKTSALLYELLLQIDDLGDSSTLVSQDGEHNVSAAVRYISEHYRETVELSQLAKAAGVSEGHFCRIFREYTHMRPIEYLTHLRIEAAKSLLLENPSLAVASIAEKVGFDNASYFSYVFRQKTGLSPLAYRNGIK
jgi:AraC-like DNA-binding protein